MDDRKSVVAHGSMMSLISVFFQHEGNGMAARRVRRALGRISRQGPLWLWVSNGKLPQAMAVRFLKEISRESRAVATLSLSVPAHGTEFSFFDVAQIAL